MAAGLKSHIEVCAGSLVTGFPDSKDLRMGTAELPVPAFTDHPAISDKNSAYPGIGAHSISGPSGKGDGPSHMFYFKIHKK